MAAYGNRRSIPHRSRISPSSTRAATTEAPITSEKLFAYRHDRDRLALAGKPVLPFGTLRIGTVPETGYRRRRWPEATFGDATVDLSRPPATRPATLCCVCGKGRLTAYRALLWGGTAFNFGEKAPQICSYIASTRQMGSRERMAKATRCGKASRIPKLCRRALS